MGTGAAFRPRNITFFKDDVATIPETAHLRLLPSCHSCISASAAAEIDSTEVNTNEVAAGNAAGSDTARANTATRVDLAFRTPKERFVSFEETVYMLAASSSL